MKHTDAMIVGLGLAGALLARALRRRGLQVVAFDPEPGHSSSRIAAGVMNPVTGRRLVKAWRADEFLAFAKKTWRQIELELGRSLCHDLPVVWALPDVKAENDWLARCGDPLYRTFLRESAPDGLVSEWVAPAQHFGLTTGSARVALAAFLEAFAERLEKEGRLVRQPFRHDRLRLSAKGTWQYDGWSAPRVIFCEGAALRHNPFFAEAPLQPVKGEVLHVRLEAPLPPFMLKRKVMLVPLSENGLMWVGATFVNDAYDRQPTLEGRRYLEAHLRDAIRCRYEVVDHRAGLRPVTPDRRPLMRRHPELDGLWCFNGLAARGTMTGPLLAEQMADMLLAGKSGIEK